MDGVKRLAVTRAALRIMRGLPRALGAQRAAASVASVGPVQHGSSICDASGADAYQVAPLMSGA
jgi:hypothetical protein